MPLVKVIGAQPTIAAAAAVAIEAAAFNRQQADDIPAEAPRKYKLPVVKVEEEEEIQFFGKVPLWQDDTPEAVLAVRKIHTDFIVEVHLHALGYLVVSISQWILIYKINAIANYVKAHYCLSLLPFVLSFTMLITLVFFYDDITKGRHMAVFYCYTVIMLELSSVPVAMPLSSYNLTQLMCSGFISTVVIVAGILIAHSKKDYYVYKPAFIFAWTCRCFLVASMGIIVGISLQSPYFDVVMTLTMTFFMSLYILMCAKAISSAEFIWMDTYGPHMYGTLFYINYMTLFSMNVLLFEELDAAMKRQHH
ncbi:uncharacterized protein LOC126756918 [Bactrocera neohumeralis]|uniref:uncharacterized protein LOC120770459 n=1 Tax=Bactrocera tryoni TaxID=59916 RepID=UPI001A977455|nr:uncharacterized protein LOC120770459 [Bactrocera tryoni]XP_050326377.1 uncharacterized protein LOC126756918 [Bactrocera neohumeralis]